MAALLDVNVLVALAWPNHVHHERARRWFAARHTAGWATTPVTEAGFVRVSSNRSAISAAATPPVAGKLLRAMTRLVGHEFWPDDVPLVTGDEVHLDLVLSHGDVTDAHLLAIARVRGGRLVTFDARIARLLLETENDLLEVLV